MPQAAAYLSIAKAEFVKLREVLKEGQTLLGFVSAESREKVRGVLTRATFMTIVCYRVRGKSIDI